MKIFILTLFIAISLNAKEINIDAIKLQQKQKSYIFPDIDFSKFKNVKQNKLLGIDDPDFEEKIKKQIDDRLSALFPSVRHGISFSIKTGEKQIDYATGYSDKFNNIELTPEMPLQIASITKVYIATLIFKLQEEGKLDIDDEISKYLSPINNVNMSLKIRNLLNHSSQIHDILNHNIDLYLSAYLAPENVPSLDVILENLEAYQFDSGIENEYSNTNYTLLAKIVEVASEKSVEEYLEEVILTPLELENTFFVGKNIPEPENIANGWCDDNYIYINLSKVNDNDLSKLYEIAYGLGNIVATPSDVSKFAYNLMNGNILTEESLEEMTQQYSFDDDSNTAFGNGIFYTKLGEIDSYQHSGSLLGYQSYMFMIPSLDVAFSFTINCGNSIIPYNNNGLNEVLETILFEMIDITGIENFNLELSNINIIEENKDNALNKGEIIEVELNLRDISKRYSSIIADIYLTGETNKIEDLSPVIIDTIFSDGYTYIENKLKFRIEDNIESDFINLMVNIDDVNGETEIITLPLSIPINTDKKSLDFGTFEGRVEVPANTFDLSGAWSIEFDMNLKSFGQDLGIGQIISQPIAYTQTLAVLTIDGNLAITMINEQGANPVYFDPIKLELNKWYHITLTYDGVNNLKYYLNDNLGTLISANGQQMSGNLYTELPPFLVTIGNGINKTLYSFPFDGQIDNVRFWNKAISESEINKELMESDYSDLYFAYDFNEGFGLNVKDLTNQRNGLRYSNFGEEVDFISSVEKENEKVNISIYPLPAKSQVNIKSDEIINSLALFDLAGKEILAKKSIFSNSTKIDITNFISGTYMLKLNINGEEISKKIIKN